MTRWVVCNSEYAVDDPTFLCERCLKNTHYKDKEVAREKNNVNENDGEEIETKCVNDLEEEGPGQSDELPEKLFDFKAYHFSQL